MKKIIFLMLFICSLGIASPTVAQNTPSAPVECDLPSLQKLIDTYIETLGTVKAKETDPKQISNDLQLLANIANMQRASCDGLAFTGAKDQVIGPVTIPAGIYRVKATTTGYLIVKVSAVTGECGAGTDYLSDSLFTLSDGDAKDGAETVFTSKDCTALIQVSLVDATWQLDFERITTD